MEMVCSSLGERIQSAEGTVVDSSPTTSSEEILDGLIFFSFFVEEEGRPTKLQGCEKRFFY